MKSPGIIPGKKYSPNLGIETRIAAMETGRIRIVTFKAREGLLEILDTIAWSRGVTRSHLIREALREYIKRAIAGDEPSYKKIVLTS